MILQRSMILTKQSVQIKEMLTLDTLMSQTNDALGNVIEKTWFAEKNLKNTLFLIPYCCMDLRSANSYFFWNKRLWFLTFMGFCQCCCTSKCQKFYKTKLWCTRYKERISGLKKHIQASLTQQHRQKPMTLPSSHLFVLLHSEAQSV